MNHFGPCPPESCWDSAEPAPSPQPSGRIKVNVPSFIVGIASESQPSSRAPAPPERRPRGSPQPPRVRSASSVRTSVRTLVPRKWKSSERRRPHADAAHARPQSRIQRRICSRESPPRIAQMTPETFVGPAAAQQSHAVPHPRCRPDRPAYSKATTKATAAQMDPPAASPDSPHPQAPPSPPPSRLTGLATRRI